MLTTVLWNPKEIFNIDNLAPSWEAGLELARQAKVVQARGDELPNFTSLENACSTAENILSWEYLSSVRCSADWMNLVLFSFNLHLKSCLSSPARAVCWAGMLLRDRAQARYRFYP